MECFECNGVGLVNKTESGVVYGQEVCHVCKGVGSIGESIKVVTGTITVTKASPVTGTIKSKKK